MKQKNFYYFVEGETEEKLIKVLRSELLVIYPGKIQNNAGFEFGNRK